MKQAAYHVISCITWSRTSPNFYLGGLGGGGGEGNCTLTDGGLGGGGGEGSCILTDGGLGAVGTRTTVLF